MSKTNNAIAIWQKDGLPIMFKPDVFRKEKLFRLKSVDYLSQVTMNSLHQNLGQNF